MILSIKRMLLFFVIISSSLVFSQENKGNIGHDESGFSAFDSKEKTFQFVSETYLTSKKEIPFENLIQSGGLNIKQIGNYNNLNLNLKGEFIKVDIVQNGDNNVNMELVQQGNNQNIQNYGSNSISENMKVIQSGNGAAVIIINNK